MARQLDRNTEKCSGEETVTVPGRSEVEGRGEMYFCGLSIIVTDGSCTDLPEV
jgi:hypothetical protein